MTLYHKKCNAEIKSALAETHMDCGRCSKCNELLFLLYKAEDGTPFWNPEVVDASTN